MASLKSQKRFHVQHNLRCSSSPVQRRNVKWSHVASQAADVDEIDQLRRKLKIMTSSLHLAQQRINYLSQNHVEEMQLMKMEHEDELQKMEFEFRQFERSVIGQLKETEQELEHQKNINAQQRRIMDARNCGVCGLEPRSILFVQCGHLYYCSGCWQIGGALAIQHGCPICGKYENGQPRCTAWQHVHHS